MFHILPTSGKYNEWFNKCAERLIAKGDDDTALQQTSLAV